MSRRLALAALPVLIGAAIEVSNIGGATASLIAWLLVGLALVVLLIHWLRRAPESKPRDPANDWHRLGRELLAFARKRGGEQPPAGAAGLGPFRSRKRSKWRRLHEADTMSMYLEGFAERVGVAIRDLRRLGLLGEAEARLLASPTSPDGIERLGRRLMEFSYRA